MFTQINQGRKRTFLSYYTVNAYPVPFPSSELVLWESIILNYGWLDGVSGGMRRATKKIVPITRGVEMESVKLVGEGLVVLCWV